MKRTSIVVVVLLFIGVAAIALLVKPQPTGAIDSTMDTPSHQGRGHHRQTERLTVDRSGLIAVVRVPAGKFMMGSPADEPGHETGEDQHSVTIAKSFWIGLSEVTQTQWQHVMGENPSAFKTCGDDCPVEYVNFFNVISFCNKLSQAEHLTPCYRQDGQRWMWDKSCTGYRLPTDEEWEYAARAGAKIAFPNGGITQKSDRCTEEPHLLAIGWYCWNSAYVGGQGADLSPIGGPAAAGTHPVAKKKANDWGLFDANGNVWEWVWDDAGAPPEEVPRSTGIRTYAWVRGGSWSDTAAACRLAKRMHILGDEPHSNVGFRVIRGAAGVSPSTPPTTPTPFVSIPPPDMVAIPGGNFVMGCTPGVEPDCSNDELPPHRVTVSAFWADIHEITVSDYGRCVQAGACAPPMTHAEGFADNIFNWGRPDRAAYPVNGVDWESARRYCAWVGRRLPTEAEFEFALRGGNNETGVTFPWGNATLPSPMYGNYGDEAAGRMFNGWTIFNGYDDGYATTSPVCAFQRNPYGLCDISGNCWEWCSDWYAADYYQNSPPNNPPGPPSGQSHVWRGGGWDSKPRGARVYTRMSGSPGWGSIGFRCVKDAPSGGAH